MADVTVPFDDYQSGSLPDICVFTGKPTTDRMVLRTRIVERDTAAKPPGPILGFFAQVTVIDNPRKPHDFLLGRLPVDARHLQARQDREELLRFGAWGALAMVVIAAVAGQPWSPFLAVASIAGLFAAVVARADLRRDVPRPTPIGAGTRVHVANVHQNFADAVETDRRP